MIRHLYILGVSLIFISCGRHDVAYIINNSSDTIEITLCLNKPDKSKRPDNYFLQEIVCREKSQIKDFKLAGDCLVSFDSLQNVGIFKLSPDDRLQLPSLRMGGPSRNDYQSWEFNKIIIKGKLLEIMASEKGIMAFVHKKSPWFNADYYTFEIDDKIK